MQYLLALVIAALLIAAPFWLIGRLCGLLLLRFVIRPDKPD